MSMKNIQKCAQHIMRQDEVRVSLQASLCRVADKSLARAGRKQTNVCQNGANFLRCLALQKKKLGESSRLDVVEIARVPDMLPSFFPSWSG